MLEQQKIVDQSVENIAVLLREYAKTTEIDEAAQKALLVFVRATLSASLNQALKTSELYRFINDEMRQGLQRLYKTIASLAQPTESNPADDSGKLFCQATEQLNEVMATTLEAAENIMVEVEGLLDMLPQTAQLVQEMPTAPDPEKNRETLTCHLTSFEESLTRILTALSFQDLTGQRLKKVLAALNEIQGAVFDIYVSSGLMLKTSEDMPEKDVAEIAAESKRRMHEIKEVTGSELKGPSRGTSQSDVDSLLADLGL